MASKNISLGGRAREHRAKAVWGVAALTDAASSLRRGCSGSTVTRTRRATGEALLAPSRNRRKLGSSYNRGKPGSGATARGWPQGSVLAEKRGNSRGAKGPHPKAFFFQQRRHGRDDKAAHPCAGLEKEDISQGEGRGHINLEKKQRGKAECRKSARSVWMGGGWKRDKVLDLWRRASPRPY